MCILDDPLYLNKTKMLSFIQVNADICTNSLVELAACIIKVVQDIDNFEDRGLKLLQTLVHIYQCSRCPVSEYLYLTPFYLSEDVHILYLY
jgi:hypothetical protein